MADTLRDGLRDLANAQASWITAIASARGLFRNASPTLPMPTAQLSSADEEDSEDHDEPAQPAWVEMAQPLVATIAKSRLFVLDADAPRVVHAREKLECPVTLALPAFTRGAYPYTATALIGDELVIWTDTTEVPPCPHGTPCDRWVEGHRGPPSEAGAVLSP